MVRELINEVKRIPLRKIRGTMVYYYDHKKNARSIVNMELENGQVVKLETRQPQKNAEFVKELRRQLDQLSKLDKQNDEDIQDRKRQDILASLIARS